MTNYDFVDDSAICTAI